MAVNAEEEEEVVDEGSNIGMKFGGNHDREVVKIEAIDDGMVRVVGAKARMEEKAVSTFRIVIVVVVVGRVGRARAGGMCGGLVFGFACPNR